jgi:hypothetical protein
MSLVMVNRNLRRLRLSGAMTFRDGKLQIRDWKQLCRSGEFDAD